MNAVAELAGDRRNSKFTGAIRLLKRLASLKLELFTLALLGLTVAAIRYEEPLLERNIVYTPADEGAFLPYFYGDQSNGGTSTAAAASGHPLSWTCRLEAAYQFPYCGFGLLLDTGHEGRGVDLGGVHTVILDLTFEGPAETLRIDLKNRDERNRRYGDAAVEKVNSVETRVEQGAQSLELSLADFHVASWWVTDNRIPPELSHPEFGNITALEMQTGTGARVGQHRLRIDSVRFEGALLTPREYYSALFLVWLVYLTLVLIHRRRQYEQLQKRQLRQWRTTLDAIPQMVWSMSADSGEEYQNAQWDAFAGARIGKEGGPSRVDIIHPDDRAEAVALWRRSIEAGEPFEAEYRMLHRSGEYRHVLSRGLPERDQSGFVSRWYGTCTDIHDRVLAQEDLARSQNFIRQLIEATPDGILVIDEDGNIAFANEAARRTLDIPDDIDLFGKPWMQLVPRDVRRAAMAAIRNGGLDGPQHFTAETEPREGERSWWDVIITPLSIAQRPARLLVISRDISHQKKAEEQARWSAKHDSLTELPNRSVVQQELDVLTSVAGTRFATLLLDIDEFKKINDTLGHDAGDELLCSFADRLKMAARPDDLVARLGGDEFAVILKGVRGNDEIRAVAERIFAELRNPCVYQGKIIDLHASIGASLYPRDGGSKAELMKNADIALYVAKASGRGNMKIFDVGMRSDVELRHGMISRARRALADDTIVPYYQPKVEIETGRIAGFEALLRWRHPERGIQTPDTIKAAFEDLTLAAEISDRMIDHLIVDARDWLDQGLDFDHVAFNAAAAELRAGNFAERLLERLEKAQIPARCIQMEVTETVFLGRGAEYVERALKVLSENGIRIALDDFGTGYASLSHLKAFPVDLLKIDRSFVQHLGGVSEDGGLVEAVVGLGRSLGIEVIAEGIETSAQHEALKAMGCRFGQGFLYARPMAAREVRRICSGDRPSFSAAAA